MSISPTRMIQVLLARGSGTRTLTELRRKPEGIDLGPLQAGQLPGRLRTRDRTLDLAPALVLEDLLRLGEVAPPADGELVLIGRRHKQDCNSWMHNSERLTKGRPRHQLLMHPDDLAARGLLDGATVTVSSRVGSVKVDVQATEDVMPGVVSLPHGYGHQARGTRQSRASVVPGCRSTTSPTPNGSTCPATPRCPACR